MNEEKSNDKTPDNSEHENAPGTPQQLQNVDPETTAPVQKQPVQTTTPANPEPEQEKLKIAVEEMKAEISKVLIGQEKTVDLLLAAILTNGHVLLEGVPGIAKTLMARLLAQTLDADFSRIQFTPDLMPADVLGTNVYNMKNSTFEFSPGPIFGNIILIDEINRSPAKTQAALFEVMEERQITTDGITRKLDFPFFVIATQNPIEQEGTYRLPEAQLDRFTFRLRPEYPTYDEEVAILERFKNGPDSVARNDLKPIISKQQLKRLQHFVFNVHIEKSLIEYVAKIIQHTRETGDLFLGASPRASLAMVHTSKAIAALQGRAFVIPDDIKFAAVPVLNHRLILSPDKEVTGTGTDEVIDSIINKVEVPR